MTRNWTIIVAGGAGTRMGAQMPKQFIPLDDKPIIVHTLNAFHKADPTMGLVVVLPEAHFETWREICKKYAVPEHTLARGGASRFDSVAAGLKSVPQDAKLVGVQDGVRPFASTELIHRCFEQAEREGSAIPVVPAVDSFRQVGEDGYFRVVDRSTLRAVQTPQVFRAELLRRAYAECAGGEGFTDDASVVEALGERVCLVEGERFNIKITTPEDLLIGSALIRKN